MEFFKNTTLANSKKTANHKKLFLDLIFIEKDSFKLLPEFLRNRSVEATGLRQLIFTKNYLMIKKIARDLQGLPGAFGYLFLLDLGHQLESAAENKNLDALIDLANQYKVFLHSHHISIIGERSVYHCRDLNNDW